MTVNWVIHIDEVEGAQAEEWSGLLPFQVPAASAVFKSDEKRIIEQRKGNLRWSWREMIFWGKEKD